MGQRDTDVPNRGGPVTRQWDNGTHGTPPAGVNFQRLDRNQWRAIAQFNVTGDELDLVDLDSFSIRVEVEVSDGWAEFCTIHWTNLGMELADVERAWEEVLRQHREG